MRQMICNELNDGPVAIDGDLTHLRVRMTEFGAEHCKWTQIRLPSNLRLFQIDRDNPLDCPSRRFADRFALQHGKRPIKCRTARFSDEPVLRRKMPIEPTRR